MRAARNHRLLAQQNRTAKAPCFATVARARARRRERTRSKQHDYVFKYIIIGDSGVGKSCLKRRFMSDKYGEDG